ncbi:MAG TPA: COX15/CtaA family protein [Acidimicrobiia bacterium]|jgi:cytochrome c oxidase assembly protein subunit 15
MRVADRPPSDTSLDSVERQRDLTRTYRILAIVMVVMLCTIIVSGAIVRLSNSGLGCSDWPRCEPGHFTDLGNVNQRIEQFNRFYSGLIIVPIAISLIVAYMMKPRRREFVTLSWILVVLYLFEAVLGGVAVLVDLQWVSVMSHFLLAIVLLGVSLVNLDRARRAHTPEPSALATATRRLVIVVWVGVVAIIVLGTLVTAAGPHGGDRLHAARLRWPIEDAARTHGVTVNVVLALLLYLIWRLRRERHAVGVHVAGLLLIAMFVQAGIGYVQWYQQIPPVLVGFHVGGATIVFVAATWMLLTLAVRPSRSDAPEPVQARRAVWQPAGS